MAEIIPTALPLTPDELLRTRSMLNEPRLTGDQVARVQRDLGLADTTWGKAITTFIGNHYGKGVTGGVVAAIMSGIFYFAMPTYPPKINEVPAKVEPVKPYEKGIVKPHD